MAEDPLDALMGGVPVNTHVYLENKLRKPLESVSTICPTFLSRSAWQPCHSFSQLCIINSQQSFNLALYLSMTSVNYYNLAQQHECMPWYVQNMTKTFAECISRCFSKELFLLKFSCLPLWWDRYWSMSQILQLFENCSLVVTQFLLHQHP